MKKAWLVLLGVFVLLGFSSAASAALTTIGTATYNGNNHNLIYDDVQRLVWLDYTKGGDTWQNQVNWASGLNNSGVLTYNLNPGISLNWTTNWRLPATVDGPYSWGFDGTTTAGYNITNSEMGHLYYVSLGNLSDFDTNGNFQTGSGLQNTGFFNNLLPDSYWSGTEYLLNLNTPWSFGFAGGFQIMYLKSGLYHALAVRPGQVSAVPAKSELVLSFGPAYGLYHYDKTGGWKQWNTVNPSQMVTVDLNGDGTDELVAAFPGYGLYTYDSANGWQQINTVIPEFLGAGRNSRIACDYGAEYGLWLWDLAGGWRQINTADPDKMIFCDIDGDGRDELIVSFIGYGLYYYDSPGVFTQIETVIPENLIRLNDGIACDFGASDGLRIWTLDGGWQQWNTADPGKMLAVDIDNDGVQELMVSFPGYGLYYDDGTGAWPKINDVIPENMIRLNNGIACDFGGAYGLWYWSQAGGWQQSNTADPGQMTAVDIDNDNVGECVVSFSGYGLYYHDETNGWQLLNAVVPDDMKPFSTFMRNEYTDFWFLNVPEYGSSTNLRGHAGRFDPDEHSVAVYIKVGDLWWPKPYYASRLTPIYPDGFWECDITTGGNDQYATEIAAFLVPTGIVTPECNGGCSQLADIPTSVGFIHFDRSPAPKTIPFAGFEWALKNTDVQVGPGWNYFSDDEDKVWVDDEGLHLTITQDDGKWHCTEVINTQTFGYGTYIFQTRGRVDTLDRNMVFGAFTWNTEDAEHYYTEIDAVEYTRWGKSEEEENTNAQYVVQPCSSCSEFSSNCKRFRADLADENSDLTHYMTWKEGEIEFRTYYGQHLNGIPPASALVQQWLFAGEDVPEPSGENFRFNFWLYNSSEPFNKSGSEITITGFSWQEGPPEW